jgi:hypothetical protein
MASRSVGSGGGVSKRQIMLWEWFEQFNCTQEEKVLIIHFLAAFRMRKTLELAQKPQMKPQQRAD